MTPAQLHTLLAVHTAVHDPKGSGGGKHKQRVSKDPAVDLAQLASL